MGIDLVKGQRIDLTKDKELTKVLVGLGWDTNSNSTNIDFDLDCSVFLLNEKGIVTDDSDFIFYKNLTNGKGVTHTGDNRTGDGDGDDESIIVDFTKIPKSIHRIVFVVTIYQASLHRQNFGQVENSYIRLVDLSENKELLYFDLGEEFSTETSLEVSEIYRYKGEWKFKAIGAGKVAGLEEYCKQYGIYTK